MWTYFVLSNNVHEHGSALHDLFSPTWHLRSASDHGSSILRSCCRVHTSCNLQCCHCVFFSRHVIRPTQCPWCSRGDTNSFSANAGSRGDTSGSSTIAGQLDDSSPCGELRIQRFGPQPRRHDNAFGVQCCSITALSSAAACLIRILHESSCKPLLLLLLLLAAAATT